MMPGRILAAGIVMATLCTDRLSGQSIPALALDQALQKKQAFLERATTAWSKVTRWEIEYEATSIAQSSSTGFPVHKIMAVSSPGNFYHMAAHIAPNVPWQVDPFSQELYVSNGSMCHRWPFNRVYSDTPIAKGGLIGGTLMFDVLLQILPSWPLTDYRIPTLEGSTTPMVLLEALESPAYQLQGEALILNGENCVLFGDAMGERIWLSKDKGLSVVQRELREPRSSALVERLVAENISEVRPGLWLPTTYRIQQMTGKPGFEVIEREIRVQVLRLAINDEVSLARFRVNHLPGEMKPDDHGIPRQVTPGGEDQLEKVIDLLAHTPKPPDRGALYRFRWLGIGTICGLIIGFGFSFSEWRGMRSAEKGDSNSG